jgi:hypothetical protein
MAQLDRPTGASSEPRPIITTIGEIRPQDQAAVTGVICASAALSISGCPACRYTLADGTGEVDLMFLGRVMVRGLDLGQRCSVEGTAANRDGQLVIWNPRYRLHPDDAAGPRPAARYDPGQDHRPRPATDRVPAVAALGRIQPAR